MTTVRHLANRAREAHDLGVPVVLGLDGPGATGLAAAFTRAEPTFLASLPFRAAPPSHPCVLWLHDRAVPADLVLEALCFRPTPCPVILTGPALDAGRPGDRETLEVPTSGAAGPASDGWTRIEPPLPDRPQALRELVVEARARCDLALALAAHEALGSPDLELSLLRLLNLGRHDEIDGACFGGTRLEPGVLAVAAVAALKSGPASRATNLLEAALVAGPSARIRTDLEYLRARVRGVLPTERPEPADPSLLDRHLMECRLLGDPRAEARLRERGSVIGGLLADCDPVTGREALAPQLVPYGQLLMAREAWPSTWCPESDVRSVVGAERALLAGNPAGAASLLDAYRFVSDDGNLWAGGWLLMRAAAAACLGDRPAVIACCRRLPGRLPIDHVTTRAVLSEVGTADPWSRLYLWTRASDWVGEPELVLDRVQESPDTSIVLGEYVLDRELGRGGMASVWLGTFAPTGARVAVKVLGAADSVHTDLFAREIEIVSRLDHPHIVTVLDFGTAHGLEAAARPDVLRPGHPYLVMEVVGGGTLSSRMGRLPWDELEAVLLALLDALAYAHARGVIHRDLKPSNVLVDGQQRVRLSDFGLAGLRQGTVAGTPMYMAPEQFTSQPVDHRADLFALGCLAWAMATGLPPWMGPPASIQAAQQHALPHFEPAVTVPEGLGDWLGRLLALHPSDRFQTAAEAAAHLLELGEPVESSGPARRPTRPAGDEWRSQPTFALPATQLGVPASDLVFDRSVSAARRVRHLFSRRHAYRPRLPTTNLLERGDPDVGTHPEARARIEERMLECVRTGTPAFLVLDGPAGIGRSHTVRAVRLLLRMRGWDLEDTPRDGPALVDAGNDPVEGWLERARDRPWLVVWTRLDADRVPPDLETVRMTRLPLDQLYWFARVRLPVEPIVAMELARRSNGYPAVLLQLLREWLRDPGFVPGEGGLQLAGPTPDLPARVVDLWRAESSRAPHVESFRVAALLVAPFASETWVATCGALGLPADPTWLRRIATDLGGWILPSEVVGALLTDVPAARLVEVHAAASRAPHPGRHSALRAARHRMLAGDSDGFAAFEEALKAEVRFGRSLPRGTADLFESRLDVAGTPHHHVDRGWCALAHLLDEAGWQQRGSTRSPLSAMEVAALGRTHGWHAVRAIALRLEAFRLREPRVVSEMVRAAARAGDAEGRVHARLCALSLAALAGAPWEGPLAEIEALAGHSTRPVALRAHCRLQLALVLRTADLLPDGLEVGPDQEAVTASLRIDVLLGREEWDAAWALAEPRVRLLGQLQSGSGMLNLGLAAAAVGDPRAAQFVTGGAARAARLGIPRLAVHAQVLLLVLEADRQDRAWDDLYAATIPLYEPTLYRVCQRLVGRTPADHPRYDALLRLLDRMDAARPSGPTRPPRSPVGTEEPLDQVTTEPAELTELTDPTWYPGAQ
ncbi:MAG: serine/threonine-protein kinase [Myxococcota bacterium]